MTNTSKTQTSVAHFIEAPTLAIDIEGTSFVYRDLGPRDGIPVVMLNHWGAVLDNFDPRIVDGLASKHRVVTLSYRGMGAAGGKAPLTIGEMANDAIALVRALGFAKIDLLGFSLGGFVAQDFVLKAPDLVRKLILTGTGPAGGEGINRVGPVSWPLIIKGLLTRRDPKTYLFFTSTANGRRSAVAFLDRLKERKQNRDKEPAFGPVLVANGDNDIMVPTVNSHDMARRLPNAQLIIYKDAGHGGIFQNYADFVTKALSFLVS
jgi:pimeloyl-ACP methyl ester carboxylesterase